MLKIKSVPFGIGERMEYKVHYAFINAADAVMKIKPKFDKIQNRDCYHVIIEGKSEICLTCSCESETNGALIIDKDLVVPRRFYRKIEEGRYRKHEIIDFDVNTKKATVKNYSNKKKKWKEPETFDVPSVVQDLVSGYYFLRTLNFDKYAYYHRGVF